jgi:hypothetical protein
VRRRAGDLGVDPAGLGAVDVGGGQAPGADAAGCDAGDPRLAAGTHGDCAVASTDDALNGQPVAEPEGEHFVDAVDRHVVSDLTDRYVQGCLDIRAMDGGFVHHPPPPESVRRIRRPPGGTRLPWVVPREFVDQRANAAGHIVTQRLERPRLALPRLR